MARLKIEFGISYSKETNWWGGIETFPSPLSYRDVKYEYAFYKEDSSKQYDYILTFGEIRPWDPAYTLDCLSWESRFGSEADACQCGSSFTSFPAGHMFYCPLWRKN